MRGNAKNSRILYRTTKKASAILIAFLLALTLFAACSPASEKPETQLSDASSESSEPKTSEEPVSDNDGDGDGTWWEGVYLKTESDPMIYIKNCGPCYMYGLTEEQLAVLAPLHTGDMIEAKFNFIQETYPGMTYPEDIRFVREGTDADIPTEEISKLREIGHQVITEEQASGLPDFEISVRWSVYGYSHYDSSTGELIKTTDATNPEDYKTTHFLTEEERKTIWAALVDMGYESYPEYYRPNPNADSEPPQIWALSVTVDGRTHTTRTQNGYFAFLEDLEDPGVINAAKTFKRDFYVITDLLENTPEWLSLPDFEHYYE